MQPTSHDFKRNARRALADAGLQQALKVIGGGFVAKRARARDRLPEFDALCKHAEAVKCHTFQHLDLYLEAYEAKVKAAGGQVHYAEDAAAARDIVLAICRARNARRVTKGKSMVAEEIGLNPHLEAAGLKVVETDLGEYIIQLRHEPPSHIVAPAVHVSRDEVERDFRRAHPQLSRERDLSAIRALVNEAREVLREEYLAADIGITGANFLIAETGSSVIVTNEGNGDLTQSLAPVHVVVTSIDKVVPTLEDAFALIRVLARSATGQEISTYTTVSTGPRRPEDPDGPEEYHVVVLDNGRSELLAGELADILRCIRCGACMNHCPVYQSIGGHAYGWVYPGPIGAVLTPSLLGLEATGDLPNASSLCGRCAEVCPMGIPLPDLLRRLRARQHAERRPPTVQRTGLALWAFAARRPRLYRLLTGFAMPLLAHLAGSKGRLRHLPLAGGWTRHRDLPAPQGQTFMAQWRRLQQAEERQ
jgi:L-lactate dehydrogenase complex protein LldF